MPVEQFVTVTVTTTTTTTTTTTGTQGGIFLSFDSLWTGLGSSLADSYSMPASRPIYFFPYPRTESLFTSYSSSIHLVFSLSYCFYKGGGDVSFRRSRHVR